jgi:hypothetical protein
MTDFDLVLHRFKSGKDATLGALFALVRPGADLSQPPQPDFRCFTCEDEKRAIKVPGETRIPAGRYEIKLRAAGTIHQTYVARYPGLHRGMLHLQNVPGFEWIYLHTGNTDKHTEGCILVGRSADSATMSIGASSPAYQDLYREVIAAMDAGCRVFIDIRDYA